MHFRQSKCEKCVVLFFILVLNFHRGQLKLSDIPMLLLPTMQRAAASLIFIQNNFGPSFPQLEFFSQAIFLSSFTGISDNLKEVFFEYFFFPLHKKYRINLQNYKLLAISNLAISKTFLSSKFGFYHFLSQLC